MASSLDRRLVFLEGQHGLLKVLTESDLIESNWVGWFNDAKPCTYNQHHYWPVNFEKQREVLSSCITPVRIQLGVIDKQAPEAICGVMSLQDISLLHRRADYAVMMDAEIMREQAAVFWETTGLLLRHGFEQLGMEKITAGTFRPNLQQAFARIFNFEVEGVLKRHVFKNNGFVDVVQMAVFRDTIRYPEL